MKRHLLALGRSFVMLCCISFGVSVVAETILLLDNTEHPMEYLLIIVFFVFLIFGYIFELCNYKE